MAVHVRCVKEMTEIPIRGGAGATVAQVPNFETCVVLEFDIGATAVELPAGTVAIQINETGGTAFRWALGGSDVTVPAAPNAHRWIGPGWETGGARAGRYIRTAAA